MKHGESGAPSTAMVRTCCSLSATQIIQKRTSGLELVTSFSGQMIRSSAWAEAQAAGSAFTSKMISTKEEAQKLQHLTMKSYPHLEIFTVKKSKFGDQIDLLYLSDIL